MMILVQSLQGCFGKILFLHIVEQDDVTDSYIAPNTSIEKFSRNQERRMMKYVVEVVIDSLYKCWKLSSMNGI